MKTIRRITKRGASGKRGARAAGRRAARRRAAKRPRAVSGFEGEIAAAKSALHEAAKTLEMLAREEPQLAERTVRLAAAGKVVPVYPTGDESQDVRNLEEAIIAAGPGGTVLLKAKDRSGRRSHFNLAGVEELFMEHEVTLKSEKKAVLRFST